MFVTLKLFVHTLKPHQFYPLFYLLVIFFLKIFTIGHIFSHIFKHFISRSPSNLSIWLSCKSRIPTAASEGGPGQWSVSIFGISLGSGAWAAGNLENLMMSSEDLLWAAKAAASRRESGGS